jgi:hypothetical protein
MRGHSHVKCHPWSFHRPFVVAAIMILAIVLFEIRADAQTFVDAIFGGSFGGGTTITSSDCVFGLSLGGSVSANLFGNGTLADPFNGTASYSGSGSAKTITVLNPTPGFTCTGGSGSVQGRAPLSISGNSVSLSAGSGGGQGTYLGTINTSLTTGALTNISGQLVLTDPLWDTSISGPLTLGCNANCGPVQSSPVPNVSSVANPIGAVSLLQNGGVLTAAQMAQQSYNPIQQAPAGFKQVGSGGTGGFHYDAYRGPGGIVVVFRGTVPTLLSNGVADVGFGVKTDRLGNYVQQAADAVKQIVEANPGTKITLVGHSLGAGVAEILGKATGFNTIGFNSPGVALAVNYYQNQTDSLTKTVTNLNPSALNSTNSNLMNITMQGEPVSVLLPGQQIGQQVTLQTTAFGSLATNSAAQSLSPLGALSIAITTNHSINTMAQQVNSGPTVLSYTSPGGITSNLPPSVTYSVQQILSSLNQPTSTVQSVVNGVQQTTRTFNTPAFKALQLVPTDPQVASAYIFATGPRDPNFAAVGLPLLSSSQGAYGVEVLQNGSWSLLASVNPQDEFVFPETGGVNEFMVNGINDVGLSITDPFPVLLAFEGDGTFTGTITALSAVPEPSSLALFSVGIAGFVVRRRRLPNVFWWRSKSGAS